MFIIRFFLYFPLYKTKNQGARPIFVGQRAPENVIPIPLVAPDPDVLLNLNQIVHNIYTDAYYHLRINYVAPSPPPKLRSAMAEWCAIQYTGT